MESGMKLAIVSGGSRGLGASLCRQYAEAGYELVEFSRSAPHPFSAPCDFTDPPQVSEIVAKRLAPFSASPALEEIVLISNAGMLAPIGPTSRKTPEDILANINANFASAILFMSEAIRAFQNSPARKILVSISSGAGTKGYAGWSLYCAAKAGLDNFVRALAMEQALEAHPFRALSIDPGIMDTHMQAGIRACDERDFPAVARFLGLHRDGALRSPDQIARVIRTIVAKEHGGGERLMAADFL